MFKDESFNQHQLCQLHLPAQFAICHACVSLSESSRVTILSTNTMKRAASSPKGRIVLHETSIVIAAGREKHTTTLSFLMRAVLMVVSRATASHYL